MPSISPDPGIDFWFKNLRQFQAACINTTAAKEDLLTFANHSCTAALTTSAEQNNFITAAAASTGYDDMAVADLTTYKTFAGLLNNWNSLPTAVAILLQSLAVPSLQTVPSKAFMKAAVADALPGGSAGPAWQAALAALTASIPPVCFTQGFRDAIAKTVDKQGSKMSDLIPQIAGLG